MKTTLTSFLFFLIILLPSSSFSQDVIQLKTGEEIKVKIVKVGDKEIEYKKMDNPDGPIYAVSKDQVASFDFNKGATTTQSSTNADEAVKLLQVQIKRDSLYLEAIKKQQEQLSMQAKQVNDNMSRLVERWVEQDSVYQNNLEKQREEIQKQQEKIQQQVNQIAGNVSQMSNAIANSTSKEEEKSWVPKKFGFGLNLTGLSVFNLDHLALNFLFDAAFEEFSPQIGYSIFLPITLHPQFRLEPEFAHSKFTSTDVRNLDTVTTSFSLSNYGTGVFTMFQRGKSNIYLGVRGAKHIYKGKEEITKIAKITTETYTENGYTISPTIGGEYLIGDHFGLGGEIAWIFYISGADKFERDNKIIWESKNSFSSTTTRTRLILRFYLDGGKDSKRNSGSTAYSSNYSAPTENTYSSPSPTENSGCASVKNGKFQMGENTIMKREGDKQTHFSKNTNTETEYKVEWVSDCEYHITSIDNPDKKIKVKIISVDKKGYDCNLDYGNGQSGNARINRVQ